VIKVYAEIPESVEFCKFLFDRGFPVFPAPQSEVQHNYEKSLLLYLLLFSRKCMLLGSKVIS